MFYVHFIFLKGFVDIRPRKKKEEETEEDIEGRAALEETQSIILLLQVPSPPSITLHL